MSLLTVVQDVCAAVGVTQPQSVFASITGNRTMQEMVALAHEMAQRIAYDTRDWGEFKATAQFNGDGVTTEFAMPSGFKRLLLTTEMWRVSNPTNNMRMIADFDEWLMRRRSNDVHTYGEWIKYGDSVRIFPAIADGDAAFLSYLDKNCINLSSGGHGDRFMHDGDTFRLDERLLKLGMTYQWKAQKGSSYAEDMSTYGDALTSAMGRDNPAPIMIDRKPISAYARTAIPTQTIYIPAPIIP